MHILHVLYQSVPHQSGSTTRSSLLLRAQQAAGLEVSVITVPFQDGMSDISPETIDGVRHYRTLRGLRYVKGFSNSGLLKKIVKLLTLPAFMLCLYRTVRIEKPDVLHAHAMFYCAFASMVIGKICRIPCVYEVRSIWYVNSHASLGTKQRSLALFAERVVLRGADAVVAISEGIKENLAYPRPDAVIVGNAIFEADIDDKKIRAKVVQIEAASPEEVTFGYIGSVIELEGLDAVLQAGQHLEQRGIAFRFDVIGGGAYAESVTSLSHDLGLRGVRFLGRLDRNEVTSAYEALHCIVNYRRPEPVAQMVTPLKPIEALSFGLPVIASDVKGIRELVPEDGNGLIYVKPSDPQALADVLEAFVRSRRGVAIAVMRGITHVRERRTWEANGLTYRSLYERMLSST